MKATVEDLLDRAMKKAGFRRLSGPPSATPKHRKVRHGGSGKTGGNGKAR